MQRVCAVDDTNIAAARAFLERHADTSMFLLSNLPASGARAGSSPAAPNFKLVEVDGEVRAVFYLSRRTAIMAESGGRPEFASAIVEACRLEPIPIGGAIGEWRLAEAIWGGLQEDPAFRQTVASREKLQTLDLTRFAACPRDPQVRHLCSDDFEEWDRVSAALLQEEGLPAPATAERRAMFERSAGLLRWWGYFEDGRLLSMASVIAVYGHRGQVGGVYTVSDRRRSGLSRATLNVLLSDAGPVHGLTRMILFTSEDNQAAQRLYGSLGFSIIGDFAWLACEPIGG